MEKELDKELAQEVKDADIEQVSGGSSERICERCGKIIKTGGVITSEYCSGTHRVTDISSVSKKQPGRTYN